MYQGNPMTQTGNFTMTTLSLRSAFEGIGDAGNGFRSKSFDDFCRSLDGFRQRVEAQYAGFVYPKGTPLAGQPFEPANGGVDRYSSDVMIPAFLSTYTSMVSTVVVPWKNRSMAFSCTFRLFSIIFSCSPSFGINSASPRESWFLLSRTSR